MSLLSRMTLLGLGHVSSVQRIPEPKESDPRPTRGVTVLSSPGLLTGKCLCLQRLAVAECLSPGCLGKPGL